MESRIRYNTYKNSINEIPSHIGFIVLLIVGSLVAWFTIHVGDKIIEEIPNSQISIYNQQAEKAINNMK